MAADIQMDIMYSTPDPREGQLKQRRVSVRNAGLLPRENVLYVILSSPLPSGITVAVTRVIDGVTYGRVHGMGLTGGDNRGLFTRQSGFLCLAGLNDPVELGWNWISEASPFGNFSLTGVSPTLDRSVITFSAPEIVSNPLRVAANSQFKRMG